MAERILSNTFCMTADVIFFEDALLAAFEKCTKFYDPSRGCFDAFFRKVFCNEVRRAIRTEGRYDSIDDSKYTDDEGAVRKSFDAKATDAMERRTETPDVMCSAVNAARPYIRQCLTDKQATVFDLRFPSDGSKGLNLSEIASIMGITHQAVSKINKKMEAVLRSASVRRKVELFEDRLRYGNVS